MDEKAWLSIHTYDGGWYGVLIHIPDQVQLHEGVLHNTREDAAGEMRRYARAHNIKIEWEA